MKLGELLDILKPYENRYPDGEILVEIDDSHTLHHLVRISVEPAGGCGCVNCKDHSSCRVCGKEVESGKEYCQDCWVY